MPNQPKSVTLILALCLLAIVLGVTPVTAQSTTPRVTLTKSQLTWKTAAYELDKDNGIVPGSIDLTKTIDHIFDTYVLENDYLKVTLLPDFGGRIISMIYKPTGHEELYQNPYGMPYGSGAGNFYYDWLMVYGGIFPTFPEPEHGKGWLVPWDFKVESETPDAITVSMSLTDDIDFPRHPGKFDTGKTGLTVTYAITLKADRAALDTVLTAHNPTDKAVNYELWMCTTLTPGSSPADPRSTAGTEIVAPVDRIKMPNWWPLTIAAEQPAGINDVYTFDKLRMFKNWPDMGIAYAYPDMQNKNFWGVINHDNQEGLMRVSKNDVTSGMKMWTWGYNSVDVDPFAQPLSEKRPYIELWAGVSSEFFKRATIKPSQEVRFEETYSPTVGLVNVTQASPDVLGNFYKDDKGMINLQLFSVLPTSDLHVQINADSTSIYDKSITLTSGATSQISAPLPTGATVTTYKLLDNSGTVLLTGELALN